MRIDPSGADLARPFLAAVAALSLSSFITQASAAPAPEACVLISNVSELQAMGNDPAGSYCLANDINAASVPNFVPVGDVTNGLFTGTFDGRGFSIRNLKINNSGTYVGMFGLTDGATIRNVNLRNVRVINSAATGGVAGGLVGLVDGNNGTGLILGVSVSGFVACTSANCAAGGLTGATNGPGTITQSSSSAAVRGSFNIGGAVGNLGGGAAIVRTHAVGPVTCTGSPCQAGGLIGRTAGGSVDLSFAAGPVKGANGADSRTGGLIGLTEAGTTIARSFALGRAIGGDGGGVGQGFTAGLIAQHNSGGDLTQTYAVGQVDSTGAGMGGSIHNAGGGPSITRSFWDTQTTGQATSVAGTFPRTTNQLRSQVPPSFDPVWAITKQFSYPYLDTGGIDFAAPLATLVRFQLPYTFLPIRQLDRWEYITAPTHADEASLATVYTMIARAIGITLGDTDLTDAEIDKYFWDDATQTTTFQGPVTNFATIGPLTDIPAATPLDDTNVIGAMNTQRLAILRGVYKKSNGTTARHWMLGTLYTQNPDDTVSTIVANDPATGMQVRIDPVTKEVLEPADFPLQSFRVTGFRRVTMQLPASDRRLKADIVKVGALDNGLALYRYRYLWGPELYVGVMAQEVAAVRPDAAVLGDDGYLRVNYAKLGTRLQTWDEWRRSHQEAKIPQ